MSFIHPSADVEPDVVIGDDTKVWHLCHLRSGARIGEGCTLGRGVYVSRGTAVGNRVNRIRVPEEVATPARAALDRMLAISR